MDELFGIPMYQIMLQVAAWLPVLWVFAFGACVGSLLNVVVYRLPLEQSLWSPPSRCPACETRLTFKENLPIIGWLRLKGRCKFCKSKISPEYPLVEAFVGLLFAATYALWYTLPSQWTAFGVNWRTLAPQWALSGLDQTWPILLIILCLFACLVAMTLIDAKTFMIPLALPHFATAVAIVGHVAWALVVEFTTWQTLRQTAPGTVWSIPTFTGNGITDWWFVGAAGGAVIGLAGSMALLHFGLIRRSFADYQAWETQALAEQAAQQATQQASPQASQQAAQQQPAAPSTDPASPTAPQAHPTPTTPTTPPTPDSPADLWIAYPHARREMFKELAFLGLPVGLAWLGGQLATSQAAAAGLADSPPPLWLAVLTATIFGYLIGGAIVWAVRIIGSLGFGKEAMGLGDVHLLAAVGAAVGWIDAVLAFFTAAVVGLVWHFARTASGKGGNRAMPYGPSLAVATGLVVLGKPFFEWLLGRLMGQPIALP
ncbi:MAG: prepilin peptidase [Planctomycetaceae bacterium]|nr:prepilin peptidase [Planctomycetaceae bacterium]